VFEWLIGFVLQVKKIGKLLGRGMFGVLVRNLVKVAKNIQKELND